MKPKLSILMLAIAVLSSISLYAQNEISADDGLIYEGKWPSGEVVLYSHKDGLILGTFGATSRRVRPLVMDVFIETTVLWLLEVTEMVITTEPTQSTDRTDPS